MDAIQKIFISLIIFSIYPTVVSLVRYKKIDISSLLVLVICLFLLILNSIVKSSWIILSLTFVFILAALIMKNVTKNKNFEIDYFYFDEKENFFNIKNRFELSFGIAILLAIFWVLYFF